MKKRQTTKTLWDKIRVFKTYLQMEKKVILICCITYLVIILMIGYIFNTKSLNEYSQLINGSVNKQLETENLYWENYLVLASVFMSDSDMLNMFSDDVSVSEMLSASYKLEKYKDLLPHISDIYLYDVKNNMVFSTGGSKRDLEDDHLVCDEFNEYLKDGSIGYKENFLVYDNHGKINSIAHVFYLSREKKRFMIILEDYNDFCEDYEYCEKSTNADIIVTMKNGTVLYGNKDWSVGETLEIEKYQSVDEKKYSVSKINKEKCIITYDTDGENRIVISLRPYSEVIKNSPFDKNWLPFYFILIMLVSQMLVMEQWVRKSMKKIQVSLSKGKIEDSGKFYLLEYLDKPTEVFPERVKVYCDKKFGRDSKIGFIILRLDSYKKIEEQYNREDLNLYKFALNNIFEEIFSTRVVITNLHGSENEFLYAYALLENRKVEDIKKAAEECRKYIQEYAGFETSYFISNVNDTEQMLSSYIEAYNILEYGYIYGKGCVLFNDVLNTKGENLFQTVVKLCNDLCNSVENNNADKELLLSKLIENMYGLDSIEIHEAVFQLILTFGSISKGTEHHKKGFIFLKLITSLRNANDLEEVREAMEQMLHRLEECEEESGGDFENRNEKYVKKVQQIIEEKYAQAELYAGNIAEELGITSKHLGRIYKSMTGITISQELTNKRLEEARKLLETTPSLSIKEVAKAVGYTEDGSNYFSTLFKKKYGKTPSDYRMDVKE